VKQRLFLIFSILGVLFLISGLILAFQNNRGGEKNRGEVNFSQSQTESSNQAGENIDLNIQKDSIERYVVVTKVLDGDTVETTKGEKIRYLGINAPENGEPNSKEAIQLNENLVLNKEVGLQFDIQRKDRYGRTLAYVFIGDVFVNLEMVGRGFAVSQTIQPNVRYQDEILNAQKRGRENCLGMWVDLCDKNLDLSLNNCINIVGINANAKGDDNKNKNGEWIELKNSCSSDVLMKGWLLKDSSASNRYEFGDFVLQANKNVLIYSGCGIDFYDSLYWKCPEGKYAIWNNNGDNAYLYNEKEEMVSDFAY